MSSEALLLHYRGPPAGSAPLAAGREPGCPGAPCHAAGRLASAPGGLLHPGGEAAHLCPFSWQAGELRSLGFLVNPGHCSATCVKRVTCTRNAVTRPASLCGCPSCTAKLLCWALCLAHTDSLPRPFPSLLQVWHLSERRSINICAHLDWKRSLAIHLWYLLPSTAPLSKALSMYEAAFQVGGSRSPVWPEGQP